MAIVIDRKVIVLGSYDFSAQAETEHVQTLLIVRSHPDLARQFRDQFFNVSQGHPQSEALASYTEMLRMAADAPPGLAAVINFAGGRRWRKPGGEDIRAADSENALVAAYRTLGAQARVPMLWIYAANDSYFGPDLARRMHEAFTAAGGRAQLTSLPAFGDDGHHLFSRGIAVWTPLVDEFLRSQNLGRREPLPSPRLAALPPPPQLRDKGRAGFADYLAAGPHKAFAVSPRGAWGSRSGQRSAADAQAMALEVCSKYAADCIVYAVDDELPGQTGAAR